MTINNPGPENPDLAKPLNAYLLRLMAGRDTARPRSPSAGEGGPDFRCYNEDE